MILQSLRELALREKLVEDPAFESKPVRWVIELTPDGRFLQLYDTNTPELLAEGSKRKPRMEARLMVVPRRQVRPGKQIKPNFLVDNAKYVLGDIDSVFEQQKDKPCEAFRQSLLQIKNGESSPELQATVKFLDQAAEKLKCLQEIAKARDFADNDLFTFTVDGFYLHDVEELRAYWSALSDEPSDGGNQVQCLSCGELRIAARIHNQIQIRGASTAGVPLVSFNAGAFEKYGWCGNENAPVCTTCMTAYVEALRRLTRSRYGEKFRPLNTVLTGDTTAIYWADNDDKLVAGLPTLRDDPKIVKSLLDSPRKGHSSELRDATRFYCLVLTGTQGRAIVRRLHTGTVAAVKRNLHRYFAAINVERFDRDAPLPQFRLLQSMVLNGELDRLPADLGTELWLHALFGEPLSRSFLAAVVGRNRAERKVSAERAALLHLYFLADPSSGSFAMPITHKTEPNAEPDGETTSAMSLNTETKDPPYLLGRLLAALESLQTAAQGQNLNRTLVDRTFGAASTRPGVVFPQLINTAQHHLSKAGKKAAGRAVSLNKLLGEIMDGLELDGFAPTLNLEQQGRFALGYYHQRQSFYRKPGPTAEASSTTLTDAEETAA